MMQRQFSMLCCRSLSHKHIPQMAGISQAVNTFAASYLNTQGR